MAANKFTFQAKNSVSAMELHALWATLTNKRFEAGSSEGFKIHTQGRLVHIVTFQDLGELDVVLATNTFRFVRREYYERFALRTGQLVTVAGRISYSVHSRETNKDLCPVMPDGSVREDCYEAFTRFLVRSTGLDLASTPLSAMQFSWDSLERGSKVWINDIIALQITAKIAEPRIFNNLAVAAIGRRRSYGFGALSVSTGAPLS